MIHLTLGEKSLLVRSHVHEYNVKFESEIKK